MEDFLICFLFQVKLILLGSVLIELLLNIVWFLIKDQ